jgi:curved DNA-binding protein CbpA
MNISHYYELLGLKPDASEEEIKQAYRDLSKVWHPDRFVRDPRLQNKAEEKMKEINEAYQKIRDYLNDLHKYQGPYNNKFTEQQNYETKTDSKKQDSYSSKKPSDLRFVFSDLTVLDTETKLVWSRDANLPDRKMTWSEANEFIQLLNKQKYASYGDWRLPILKELETFVAFGKSQGIERNLDKLFNEIGFKNVKDYYYWSSTSHRYICAWSVHIGGFKSYTADVFKTAKIYVWPVRDKTFQSESERTTTFDENTYGNSQPPPEPPKEPPSQQRTVLGHMY